MSDDGKAIKFDEATRKNSTLSLTFTDGTTFLANPAYIHSHSPSEHTIDGVNMDLEVHFVHTLTGDATQYAVFGVFFDVEISGGESNPFVASLL